MNNPGDNDSGEASSAGAPPGAPDAGRPRKPRIEVLQPGPAPAPRTDPAQARSEAGFQAAAGAAPAASSGQPAWVATNQPRPADASAEPRRSDRSGSPTKLLLLLAAIVIAGCLLYTYLSSNAEVDNSPKRTSSADTERPRDQEDGAGAATARESVEPSAAASASEDGAAPAPEPDPAPYYQPQSEASRAAAPAEARPAPAADSPEEAPAAAIAPADGDAASNTVRAFYSALSAGDGASAAQLVIPAKRRSGPLSAGALTRYYSSFRRPLRVQRVTPVDADTVRVAYDYVLPDGRACPGQAAVDVVRRDGRTLVSSIRTRGRC